MNQIEEFIDERQKAWCIHCGHLITNTKSSRDHVPSKSLLLKPYPRNLPVVRVCRSCNTGFSLDEEYLTAFLGSALSGSTEPERQVNPRTARILQTNPRLQQRIEAARSEYRTLGGEKRIVWQPEVSRIERIILKNARGHAFFEIGEPMLKPPKYLLLAPFDALTRRQRADFEITDPGAALPEVGSRMMTRILSGQDLTAGWIIVQEGIYRYAIIQDDGISVKTVLFEFLASEVYWDH